MFLAIAVAADATEVVDYSNFAKQGRGVSDAWEAGADGAQIDVRVSSDGIVYVFHEGLISMPGLDDLTYDEVVEFYSYDIPTLAEVVRDTRPLGYFVFNLQTPAVERLGYAIAAIRLSRIPVGKVVIQSDSFEVLAEVAELWPEVRRSYVTPMHGPLPFVAPLSPSKLADQLLANNIDRVSLKGRIFLTAEFIQGLKLRGFEVHVWTINLGFRAEHYLKMGVDGIVTKRSSMVVKEVKSYLDRSMHPRTVIYPLARFASDDSNFPAYQQFKAILDNGIPQFDDVFRSPQFPPTPVIVDCKSTKRLGVVLQIIHIPRQEDFASHLAWVNTVGSSVVKYEWMHSAFDDDDRVFLSRSRLRPYQQNSIFTDGMTLKKKHLVDGTVTVRITKDNHDLYETAFDLVGCVARD